MNAEDKLLQMSVVDQGENESLHKILLTYLQSSSFAVFKSLLQHTLEKIPISIDIDYVYPHPLSKSLLDIACCNGLHEFVRILLEFGANPNKLNVAHNRGPIHFATELSHIDVLKVLFEDTRTNPNLEAGRETALHFAVRKNDIQCVKVLLDNNASPNIANAKGITPIHVAATTGQTRIIDILLNFSRIPPDVDNFWDFKKQTARNLIQDKFPEIQLPLVSEKKIDFNVLRFYLDANDEEHFLDNLKYVNENLHSTDISRLMVMAVSKNFREAVKKLMQLSNDEDVNSNLYEATQVAIKCGYPEILSEFLQCNNMQITKEILLTSCQELGVSLGHSNNEQIDRLRCLKMILNCEDVNVRCEDDKGNTPLHYAARAECTEAINLLLKSGSYLGHTNILGIAPISHIAPGILEEYFNECLGSNNDRTDEHEITFDYTCLMPDTIMPTNINDTHSHFSSNSKLKSETDVLRYIACNRSLKNLLKHPLLSSYLYLKWHRIRQILYINSIFYILFYISLNCYILLMTYKFESTNITLYSHDNNTNSTESRRILTGWKGINGLWCLLSMLSILLLLREILQFISSPFRYILSIENWLEIILITLTTSILIGEADPPICAITILLSAWELVILIGQHPRMSTGIEMFKTVSLNIILFLLPYAFLILAFAMAFFTLFKDSDDANFPDPGHSLFKTIIMLTGEFDANDIPFISHPILSHFIFVLFIFLIAIVLFNLLIGLAVSDTADILSKSELVGLISRTQLISNAEKIVIGSTIVKSLNCCNESIQHRIFPLKFLSKQILFFPRYLPYGKIAVKIYKNNEIRIYGRDNQKIKNCTSLSMDSRIILKSREIISARGKQTENEKIINILKNLQLNITRLENIMNNLKLT